MKRTLQLDTHVVVWLYAGEHDRFPDALRARLNADDLRISPMVRIELTYLHEIGRINDTPDRIVGELATAVGLAEDAQSFSRVIEVAQRESFTRDPFDRIIVAQALAAHDQLATKDERILAAYPDNALWDKDRS
ncbi:type II toxin-antitoxin system VapC family toxin [Microlunatus elymi]|uniref:Type II toxin-antitoxin system VapC family toxin n=1 Tax=Microlunatus elymi TaxID=2596828 RepID=A0A516Q4M8_9ACTN|nr:PIN domain-containing protein [Microlunatus elymi]QDP98322.1 type II toxin-antitoxin system VapC family toxin [Microlunatus elymi]